MIEIRHVGIVKKKKKKVPRKIKYIVMIIYQSIIEKFHH